MIQLHQLEGFYRVAIHGGYSPAARNFPYPITQPAVHAQVRKLEEALGRKLFVRVSRDKMVLTAFGQDLFAFAAPFFEELPNVTKRIESGIVKRLRIEAGPLEIQEILPAWIRRIRKECPDLNVELREIEAPESARLIEGKCDLIVDYQTDIPSRIGSKKVGEYTIFLAFPKGRFRKNETPTAEGLRADPFVGYLPDSIQFGLQLEALQLLGATPPHITPAPSVTSILSFVSAGVGYSVVPWPNAEGPKIDGVSVLPMKAAEKFPIVATYCTGRLKHPEIDRVLSLVPKSARSA